MMLENEGSYRDCHLPSCQTDQHMNHSCLDHAQEPSHGTHSGARDPLNIKSQRLKLLC